jgi:hypothetical protein
MLHYIQLNFKKELIMIVKKYVFAVTLSFILAGCVATGPQSKPQNTATEESAVEISPSKQSVDLINETQKVSIDVSKAAAFENAQKVLVAGFKVGFVQSKGDSVKAGGGLMGGGFGGKSTAFMRMEGVDKALMQTVTDESYKQFVMQLEAAGYEVIDKGLLFNTPEFKKVKTYSFPYEVDNSGWFSDHGVSTYFSPSTYGNEVPVWAGELNGVTGGIGFSNPASATAEFAEANNIKVINVIYLIDFAYTTGKGDSFWSSSSSIDANHAVYVTPGAQLSFNGGWGGTFSNKVGSMRLEESVIATNSVGTLEDVTTTTERTVEIVTNALTLLSGMGSNITKKYLLEAEPSEYVKAAEEVAFRLNSNFVQKMADLR